MKECMEGLFMITGEQVSLLWLDHTKTRMEMPLDQVLSK